MEKKRNGDATIEEIQNKLKEINIYPDLTFGKSCILCGKEPVLTITEGDFCLQCLEEKKRERCDQCGAERAFWQSINAQRCWKSFLDDESCDGTYN